MRLKLLKRCLLDAIINHRSSCISAVEPFFIIETPNQEEII